MFLSQNCVLCKQLPYTIMICKKVKLQKNIGTGTQLINGANVVGTLFIEMNLKFYETAINRINFERCI